MKKKNIHKAWDMYFKAAMKDHVEAQYKLGYINVKKLSVYHNSVVEGRKWLKKAADQGHTQAAELLAQYPVKHRKSKKNTKEEDTEPVQETEKVQIDEVIPVEETANVEVSTTQEELTSVEEVETSQEIQEESPIEETVNVEISTTQGELTSVEEVETSQEIQEESPIEETANVEVSTTQEEPAAVEEQETSQEIQEEVPIEEADIEDDSTVKVLVLGNDGSGKSTFLREMAKISNEYAAFSDVVFQDNSDVLQLEFTLKSIHFSFQEYIDGIKPASYDTSFMLVCDPMVDITGDWLSTQVDYAKQCGIQSATIILNDIHGYFSENPEIEGLVAMDLGDYCSDYNIVVDDTYGNLPNLEDEEYEDKIFSVLGFLYEKCTGEEETTNHSELLERAKELVSEQLELRKNLLILDDAFSKNVTGISAAVMNQIEESGDDIREEYAAFLEEEIEPFVKNGDIAASLTILMSLMYIYESILDDENYRVLQSYYLNLIKLCELYETMGASQQSAETAEHVKKYISVTNNRADFELCCTLLNIAGSYWGVQ